MNIINGTLGQIVQMEKGWCTCEKQEAVSYIVIKETELAQPAVLLCRKWSCRGDVAIVTPKC